MITNNIIIGLGGTGGEIIRHLKKRVHLHTKDKQKEQDKIFIDYLYVDSDQSLNDNKEKWEVLGEDISLKAQNKLTIAGADLNGVFRNPSYYPNIIPWIGEESDWKNVLPHFASDGIKFGEQKRRLGRFLFASNVREFNSRLDTIVANLNKASSSTKKRFFICCGLSGGTGSGSFIDALLQVRKSFQDNNDEVYLYLYLAESQPMPSAKTDGGNYFANAYAGLKELNDLEIKKFIPIDVADGGKLDLERLHNTAYIITNENKEGVFLDPSKNIPEENIADIIYQRLSGADVYMNKIFQMENLAKEAEKTANGRAVRGRKFITFGTSTIKFPREEIKEYVTYKISSTVNKALLYNNWVVNGYKEHSKHIAVREIVNDSFLEATKLKRDYLTLSKPILSNEKWNTIHDYWESITQHINKYIIEAKDINLKENEKIVKITQEFQKYYYRDFREAGVQSFYNNSQNDTNSRVEQILSLIEEKLFKGWLHNKTYSFKNLNEIINEILSSLEREKKQLEELKARDAKSTVRVQKEVQELSDKFNQLGMIAGLFKKNRLLRAYTIKLRDYYTLQSNEISKTYALEQLIPQLINKISILTENINQTQSNFQDSEKKLKVKLNNLLAEEKGLNESVKKVYDKKVIDKLIDERIIVQKKEIDTLLSSFTNHISRDLNEDFSFERFNHFFTNKLIISSFEKLYIKKFKELQIHSDNVIDELKKRFGSDDTALESFINNAIIRADCFLPFKNSELNKGDLQSSPIVKGMHVLIPKSTEGVDKKFLEKIKKIIRDGATLPVEFHERSNCDEITIINAMSAFPLRVVSRVHELEKKYNEQYRKTPNKKLLDTAIHIEGEREDYNNLLIPDINKIQEESIPYLWILKAFNQIESSSEGYALVIKDENGFRITDIDLGDNFSLAHKKIVTEEDALYLKEFANEQIKALKLLSYAEHQKQLEPFKKEVIKIYKEIEDYYSEHNRSEISFFTEQAKKTIILMETR